MKMLATKRQLSGKMLPFHGIGPGPDAPSESRVIPLGPVNSSDCHVDDDCHRYYIRISLFGTAMIDYSQQFRFSIPIRDQAVYILSDI